MSKALRNLFVLAALISLASCSGCPPGGGNDNDRPPIIVGDGSIHVRVVPKDLSKGTNEEHGEWAKSGGKWTLGNYKAPVQPSHLWVRILKGAAGSTADCALPDTPFKVRSLTITYSDGASTPTFVPFDISIDSTSGKGDVVTTFLGQRDPTIPWWLSIDTPNLELNKIEFKELQANVNVWCKLQKGSEVHIYQSNKN